MTIHLLQGSHDVEKEGCQLADCEGSARSASENDMCPAKKKPAHKKEQKTLEYHE